VPLGQERVDPGEVGAGDPGQIDPQRQGRGRGRALERLHLGAAQPALDDQRAAGLAPPCLDSQRHRACGIAGRMPAGAPRNHRPDLFERLRIQRPCRLEVTAAEEATAPAGRHLDASAQARRRRHHA
jgi:hypothetical protein